MKEQDEPRSEPGHGTPEGYTEEAPAATEIGEPGTPGAGMTPEVPHAADADLVEHGEAPADPIGHESADSAVGHTAVDHGPAGHAAAGHGVLVTGDDGDAGGIAHHDAATHMDAHTSISDDDHGHAEAALGPIDWGAWGYAIAGGLMGLIVIAVFWIAIN